MKKRTWVIMFMMAPCILSAQLCEISIACETEQLPVVIKTGQHVSRSISAGIKVISEIDGFHYSSYNSKGDHPFESVMITDAGSRQETENRWKRRTLLTGLTTVVCAGATIYSNFTAHDAFDKYKSAQYMADAIKYREDTKKYDNFTKIGAGVTGAFAGWTLYNWMRAASAKVQETGISVNLDVERDKFGIVMRF